MRRAKLVRFYNLSDEEVGRMPPERVDKYWRAITILEARETLIQLGVVRYPMLKKEARAKYENELYKKAFPENKRYTTFAGLQQDLKLRG